MNIADFLSIYINSLQWLTCFIAQNPGHYLSLNTDYRYQKTNFLHQPLRIPINISTMQVWRILQVHRCTWCSQDMKCLLHFLIRYAGPSACFFLHQALIGQTFSLLCLTIQIPNAMPQADVLAFYTMQHLLHYNLPLPWNFCWEISCYLVTKFVQNYGHNFLHQNFFLNIGYHFV